jgi:hypothetical protein
MIENLPQTTVDYCNRRSHRFAARSGQREGLLEGRRRRWCRGPRGGPSRRRWSGGRLRRRASPGEGQGKRGGAGRAAASPAHGVQQHADGPVSGDCRAATNAFISASIPGCRDVSMRRCRCADTKQSAPLSARREFGDWRGSGARASVPWSAMMRCRFHHSRGFDAT